MMIRHNSNPALTAALATIALALTGCSADEGDPVTAPTSSVEPAATEDESATNPAPEVDYTVIGAVHQYGPGRWALPASGDPDAPVAVFDIPRDFQGREAFVWIDRGTGANHVFGQLTYWTPSRVPVDPCDVDTPSPPVGPTVEDLAAALVAQKRTTTTEPVPVELDGHHGLYLELQSPTDFDYASCGPEGAMQIWQGGRRGDGRYLGDPATDRYWILGDVGDRPVVLTAMTLRPTNSEAVALITTVAETTTFVDPE